MLAPLVAALLTATPLEVAQPADAPSDASWVVQLRMGTPSLFVSVMSGASLGGLGVAALGPSTGLFVERALAEHWTVELGLGGSASRQLDTSGFEAASLTVDLSVRWYPGRRLDGLWVGAGLPTSVSRLSSLVSVGSAWERTQATNVSFGLDAAVGWAFRWSNRFFATLAIGPALTWSSGAASTAGQASSFSSGQVSLAGRSYLGVGVAL